MSADNIRNNMTFTHQQNILYEEFLDEYIGEHTLENFIEWCKYEVGEAPDPNTPTRPVDDRKCFLCLEGEGHNEN